MTAAFGVSVRKGRREGGSKPPLTRLRTRGRPRFDLSFYAVNRNGEFGAASFFPSKYAAWDGSTPHHPPPAPSRTWTKP